MTRSRHTVGFEGRVRYGDTLNAFYEIVPDPAVRRAISETGLRLARALGGWRTNLRAVARGLVDTVALTGAILLIVGCASAMAWALTQSGFSRQLGAMMHAVPGGAYGFLAVSILAFLVLGSVLEGLPAVVLLAPIVWPIARSFAIDEVHYAIVIVLAMGIGLFAPPFGVGYSTTQPARSPGSRPRPGSGRSSAT